MLMKMVEKLLVGLLAAGLIAAGTGCIDIADSFLVSLNLPTDHCFTVGPGSGDWSGNMTVSIRDLIEEQDEDYVDDIQATWVTDIIVSVGGSYPSGPGASVSGEVEYRLDGGPWVSLLAFEAAYSALAAGVSLLEPDPSLVNFDEDGVNGLAAALTSDNGLPVDDEIELSAHGTTAAVGEGVTVCVNIVMGADVEVEP